VSWPVRPDGEGRLKNISEARLPEAKPILVVDDSEDLQDALHEVLRDAGYPVACARNGREALDYLLTHPSPPLMILDLKMPVLSGWDLLVILKSYSRLSHIPVLVISAGESLASIASGNRLQKPFTGETLLNVVQTLARKR
jgi:two-component system, chemotaxis family, chemotaxis protein CheY